MPWDKPYSPPPAGDPPSRRPKHVKVIAALRQALAGLGEDYASGDARGHIVAALRVLEKSHDRDVKRKTAMQEAYQKGVGLHREWWGNIESNVRKAEQDRQARQEPDGTEQ